MSILRVVLLMCTYYFIHDRDWIAIAKRLEKGQAGEEIFEIRFEEAAQKNGLILRPQFEELE